MGPWPANTSGAHSDARGTAWCTPGIKYASHLAMDLACGTWTTIGYLLTVANGSNSIMLSPPAGN
jgi:hypothetical protein